MGCNPASHYFELVAKPNWHLRQHRVNMKPDLDHTGVRKALLYAHDKKVPGRIFDGLRMPTITIGGYLFSSKSTPIILHVPNLFSVVV